MSSNTESELAQEPNKFVKRCTYSDKHEGRIDTTQYWHYQAGICFLKRKETFWHQGECKIVGGIQQTSLTKNTSPTTAWGMLLAQ